MRTPADEDRTTPSGGSPQTETVRDGPRRMSGALRTEVDAHRAESADDSGGRGQRLAGLGRHRSRQVVYAPHRVAPVRAGARFRSGRPLGHLVAVAA